MLLVQSELKENPLLHKKNETKNLNKINFANIIQKIKKLICNMYNRIKIISLNYNFDHLKICLCNIFLQ